MIDDELLEKLSRKYGTRGLERTFAPYEISRGYYLLHLKCVRAACWYDIFALVFIFLIGIGVIVGVTSNSYIAGVVFITCALHCELKEDILRLHASFYLKDAFDYVKERDGTAEFDCA